MKEIIAIFLVLALLSYGCLEQPNTNTHSQQSNQVQQNNQNTQSNQQNEQTEQSQNTQINDQGNGQEQANDLNTETLVALSKLGTPIECDVYTNENGQEVHVKLYLLKEDFKAEVVTSSQSNLQYSIVKKGDKVYFSTNAMGLDNVPCDWIYFEQDEQANQKSINLEKLDAEKEQGLARIDCKVGVFGQEKLETPGKVCSMADLMKGYQ